MSTRNARAAAASIGIRYSGGAIQAHRYRAGMPDRREAAWHAEWAGQLDRDGELDCEGGGEFVSPEVKHDFMPLGKLGYCAICGEKPDARIAFDGSEIVAEGGRRVHTNPLMSAVWKHPELPQQRVRVA